MREIKFRGKRTNDGRWVYGGIVHYENHYGFTVDKWFITDNEGDNDEVQNGTVGQFIGLKDKNGAEIYEGDIVQGFLSYSDEDRAYIVYEEDSIGFVLIPAFDRWLGRDFEIQDSADIEVIGNIYDNPELLEVEE